MNANSVQSEGEECWWGVQVDEQSTPEQLDWLERQHNQDENKARWTVQERRSHLDSVVRAGWVRTDSSAQTTENWEWEPRLVQRQDSAYTGPDIDQHGITQVDADTRYEEIRVAFDDIHKAVSERINSSACPTHGSDCPRMTSTRVKSLAASTGLSQGRASDVNTATTGQ